MRVLTNKSLLFAIYNFNNLNGNIRIFESRLKVKCVLLGRRTVAQKGQKVAKKIVSVF